MTVDDERLQLRIRLEELVGMSGAEFLMDRPRGGWSELVTTSELDLRLDAFEARFGTKLATLEHRIDLRFAGVDARFDHVDARLDRFEHQLLAQVDRRLRSQSWVTISTVIAAMSVIVAAIRI
jgi:hypothetical protein